jgi:ribonuclease III
MANSERQQQLERFAQELTLPFHNWDLLDDALTHASACNDYPHITGHYETLEFLGDATLELVISDILFRRNPKGTPGLYTQIRALVVNKSALAQVGRSLNIGPYIQLGKGEENSGGRERDSLLAAIYLDAGWEAMYQFIQCHFMQIIEEGESSMNQLDYRSQIQNYCQSQKMDLPIFKIVKEEGPDHQKMFETEVYVGERLSGTGRGSSKKSSEQEAARIALVHEGVVQNNLNL